MLYIKAHETPFLNYMERKGLEDASRQGDQVQSTQTVVPFFFLKKKRCYHQGKLHNDISVIKTRTINNSRLSEKTNHHFNLCCTAALLQPYTANVTISKSPTRNALKTRSHIHSNFMVLLKYSLSFLRA